MNRRRLLRNTGIALVGATAAGRFALANAARGPGVGDAAAPVMGLDFPGSTWQQDGACRFTFHNPLPAYPATYIWECMPRKQRGFYTTFFWGPSGSEGADDFYGDRVYYGAHPYPDPRGRWHAFEGVPPALGPQDGHRWEIAIDATDITGPRVAYDRWHVQALRVDHLFSLRGSHEYFVDLAPGYDPSAPEVKISPAPRPDIEYHNWIPDLPPKPGLVWGDAPWVQARGREVFNGIIRGIRIYAECLSDEDLVREASEPLSTDAGRESIWYMNMNPTPDGLVSDPIGSGRERREPVWSTERKARLWTLPMPDEGSNA